MKKGICLIVLSLVLINFIGFGLVSSLSISVHVPEKYVDVIAGEIFYFETEIKYPENPTRVDLRFNYEVLNQEREKIAQAKVVKAIETQMSFIDSIFIPESAEEGLHIIKVITRDYGSLEEVVEASFWVAVSNIIQFKIYFYIMLGAILLVGVLVVIDIFLYRRR